MNLPLHPVIASIACLFLATLAGRSPGAPIGYYRLPAIHQDTIIFTSEGDLWRVPLTGGVAQRLTTHPGMESHAAISPDGRLVAFAAEYEGPTEVYTMPLEGGVPTRRTFDGHGTTVAGWSPDGKILVRTGAYSTLPSDQLALIDAAGAQFELLPLAEASEGAFDPVSETLFFTRLPRQGSSTKRYRGGWIQNLWRFHPDDREATAITADFQGTSKNPLWWNGRVYFLSDRDGLMNLWSCQPDGSDPRQHTRHRDFDVDAAALHAGRIVYQHGADLRLYDIPRDADTLVPIRLASDFDQQRERWVKKPLEFLTSAHLSPDGDRIVLTARGQVFVAPAEQGRLVEIPQRLGVRYRNARFLPDGRHLNALSDASGELEFWELPANGVGPARQITTNGTVFRFEGVPSPDGQWLAWGDKDLRLWIHQIERHESRLVAESRMGTLTDFAWSPDSRWIAYVQSATNTYSQIKLYRLGDETRATVTSDRVESYSPTWSPDGKWLYFLSDRELRSLVPSPWGPRQPDPYFTETAKIYHLALTSGLRSPFAPDDELWPGTSDTDTAPDENGGEKKENKDSDESSNDTGTSPASVSIELDGLSSRLHEVPLPAGNYRNLSMTGKHLYWVSRDTGFESKPSLRQLEITHKDPKPKTVVEDIRGYELSANRKKLLVRKGDDFHVVPGDTAAPAKLEKKVGLGDWTFSVQPREEWRQIFTESWRMMRDYFYDRGMHQLDWPGTLRKYLPLVDRVSDRAELNALISQMLGELSTLHIYVGAGDERQGPDEIAPAALGARLAHDPDAGGWRIQHIYQADPDDPRALSPLAKPGHGIRTNEIITAINGQSTLGVPHPSLLLRNQAGKQVLLELRSAAAENRRRVIVVPITASREADLRYDEWELTRRRRVEELGRGAIGYVHLRAMGTDNIAEWARDFYPVFQRQGLILDVRNNRGGNIDSWILGKLLRKAWFYWQPRVGDPIWNMHYAFRGHMVVLCNPRTASDGEAFAEGFRRLGLGKVIGTRTWGGEIWLSAQRWLVDRGLATAAEIGVYGPEGQWLIEGYGVEPDITVDNLPHATFLGGDAQLEAAVKHLQELIARDPRPIPPTPEYPNKAFTP
jgi:tricorn protease